MKSLTFTLLIVALGGCVQAAVNGACSANGIPGVCLVTSSCSSGGGTSRQGIALMTLPMFSAVQKLADLAVHVGSLRAVVLETQRQVTVISLINWTNHIKQIYIGLCPGPSDFKCCLPASGGCGAPAVNTATVDLIKLSEGFVASPSPDPIGLPTVGYGHLCKTSGCGEVPYSFPLTTTTATALLKSDLPTFQNCIARDIADSVRLNANQYGALVSWAFNVGCSNTGSSTLIRRLNAGESPNTVAEQELPRWNMAGGVVLPGLVTRRNREIALFKTASSVIAHPPPC
jgi:lysozyme